MLNKVTLGYWRIRGRGQIPRLLLAYTGAVWEDVQYTSPVQWFGGDKETLGLDFPNLPYLLEGDLKISETSAIISYIVERSNQKELLGKNLHDRALVQNIDGVLSDCLEQVVKVLYTPGGLTQKESCWEKLKPKLGYLAKFKGNKEWLLGYLTVADFLLVEFTYYIEQIYPEEYAKLPFLNELRTRFAALPEIKKYYEQESSIKAPFTSLNYSNIKF